MDLRGAPVETDGDESADGVERVVSCLFPNIPPVTFMEGGGHKMDISGGKCGEIIAGFFMSIPGHPIWQVIIDKVLDAMEEYEELWQSGGEALRHSLPHSLTHSLTHAGPHAGPHERRYQRQTTSDTSPPDLIRFAVNSSSWDTSCIALEPAAS